MSDIIQLLPDHVASQIAAGEVIQRPASALKEMLENSVDAGATHIQVVLREAGKTLIQVVDNGCGMSENDARMCFERHATSKIRTAEELSRIHTLGFRGEALASIAAVARVELRTRKSESESGTLIIIEGSEVKKQEAVACNPGTSLSVRQLFYNVPARRSFLKSNAVETRHLIDEFEKQALAHPEIAFRLQHDGNEIYHLTAGNLKQRLLQLYGHAFSERIVPVEEETSIVRIRGFIIKPEFCKKSRGEQFFFVNRRFIRDSYLHHAVTGAYADLLPRDAYASYFIHLIIDPGWVDVNIHPTKTEVKFQDERLVYSILKSAVRRALGLFSLTPSLDFTQDVTMQLPAEKFKEIPRPPTIKINPSFNPFESENRQKTPVKEWIKFFEDTSCATQEVTRTLTEELKPQEPSLPTVVAPCVLGRYILLASSTALHLVDIHAAAVRIVYDRLMQEINKEQGSQQILFPVTVEFNQADAELVNTLCQQLKKFGFDISPFGKNTWVVNGVPSDFPVQEVQPLLELLLDDRRKNVPEITMDQSYLARRLARIQARQTAKPKDLSEAGELIKLLLQTSNPNYTPGGKKIILSFTDEEITRRFKTAQHTLPG